MLEEQVVSFKVAKLAWGKGFRDTIGRWRGKSYYNYKGELNGDVTDQLRPVNRNNPKFDSVAAPTQSLLQTWLRNTHNIHVEANFSMKKEEGLQYFVDVDIVNIENESYESKLYKDKFNSYEEALDVGLFEGLNLIKE